MIVEADVAVVGAGPAGSTAAALLARQGLRVVLVERAEFPRDTVCGGFVSAEGVAVLRRLGALGRIPGAPRVERVRIHSASGRIAESALPTSSGEFPIAVRRSAFDAALRDLALEAGARSLAPARVVALLWREDSVGGVEALDRSGKRIAVTAPLTIGADGKHSTVAAASGALARPAKWVGFAGFSEVPPRSRRDGLDLYLYMGGYGGILELEKGVANVCGLVAARLLPEGESRRDPAALLASTFLANEAAGKRLASLRPLDTVVTTGALPLRARRPAGPGFALVGDAAGMIDPFTGDGIAIALRGAEILAEAVAISIAEGDFPRGVERRYARAARREFARRRSASAWLRLAAMRPVFGEAAMALAGRRPSILDAWVRLTRG